MKLNLGSGRYPLDGFLNLDKEHGFLMERDLDFFREESVDAITISHALMYVEMRSWADVFRECRRILVRGGILRITEDELHDPTSTRLRWHDAVTETGREETVGLLIRAGFAVLFVDADSTCFKDRSLIQTRHGDAPDVFHLEAVKE